MNGTKLLAAFHKHTIAPTLFNVNFSSDMICIKGLKTTAVVTPIDIWPSKVLWLSNFDTGKMSFGSSHESQNR